MKKLAEQLDIVKRRVAAKLSRETMIKAQPLRKRNRTLIKSRKEELADMTKKKSKATVAAATAATEAATSDANERTPVKPKVKNVVVSHGQLLLNDMLACAESQKTTSVRE